VPMNPLVGARFLEIVLLLAFTPLLLGCGSPGSPPAPTPETVNGIHRTLGKAGYDELTVSSGKGVVTVSGTVASAGDKAYAGALTKTGAGSIFVSNEITVRSPSNTIEAKLVTQTEDQNSNYHVVRVFYATDRKQSNVTPPVVDYSGERADSDTLSFGTLDVSIPKDHKIGEIERPSILRFEIREDPEKHVVILKVAPKPEAKFFSELSSRVDASSIKQAFVFIHGYDVTFADGARRAAQLAYDLDFDGAPILYSWPSKGELVSYPADEAAIDWSTAHLKQFLEKVASESHATTIHLIAHSMGNRALTASLSSIAKERPAVASMFSQVFLAAPDIDVGLFKQLAATFPTPAGHVTLYASSKDEALKASRKFHQGRRAGDAGDLVVVPNVDTIDATAVDTEFLGHSYYGDKRSLLTDIFSVMKRYDPPDKRFGMRPNRPKNATYWIFSP
jgi:esterase/lipase superfamily enzyme